MSFFIFCPLLIDYFAVDVNFSGIRVSKRISSPVTGWMKQSLRAWSIKRPAGFVSAPYLESPAIGCRWIASAHGLVLASRLQIEFHERIAIVRLQESVACDRFLPVTILCHVHLHMLVLHEVGYDQIRVFLR